jgi:hypothetical protein
MEKMGTFHDKMIHITPRCVVDLHSHWNKMVPFMKPFTVVDLTIVLNSEITHVGQVMTLEVTVSHIGSVTITSRTKT